jgi:hypothetical protein
MHAKHPLIPLSIFRPPERSGRESYSAIYSASLFSVFFFTTLYLQDILHYSPVRTGLSFLPVPFAIALTATNAPKIIKRGRALSRLLMTAHTH